MRIRIKRAASDRTRLLARHTLALFAPGGGPEHGQARHFQYDEQVALSVAVSAWRLHSEVTTDPRLNSGTKNVREG